ncbi:predicted protein [Uncinocarpus reesii 1704]|uniref:Dynactin subunit n=1 Tax=Uncinocarpus reesii (strain UAMH 1704) TaxID=336963 RepID=C4JKS5_UNCRE|nr:uncharacterized protein UREG_00621 [Uncinocarpus reesii 1704]EEP75774.1 predicted protein [Uncinocarpus reesii 1704]
MAFNKKYAGLPDLDLAPDIYETPELTDDSTVPRRSYRTVKRARRRRDDGTEVLGDISDEEEESLERKLARLRREAEELKDELAIFQLPPYTTPLSILSNAASFDARLRLLEAALGLSQTPIGLSPNDSPESDLQPILPTLHHLSSQLSTLTSTLTGSPSTGPPALPTTLTTPHLESLTTRIRKLTADAEALTVARRRATEAARAVLAARIAAATTDEPPEVPAAAAHATPTETEAAASEQAAKIQALYTTLPTITSLHPLLPSVLERLRSLRAIHAGAARAGEDLGGLERRQAEMKKEIERWREGLKAMEERVKESEATMKGNVEVMGPWIRDLERRLDVIGK